MSGHKGGSLADRHHFYQILGHHSITHFAQDFHKQCHPIFFDILSVYQHFEAVAILKEGHCHL